MKHAPLWKKVLHEGLGAWDSDVSSFVRGIVTSTVIVDSRPASQFCEAFDWKQFVSLAFPFESFWIEAPYFESDGNSGTHVTCSQRKDFWNVNMTMVSAPAGKRPCLCACSRFAVRLDGSLFLNDRGAFQCETVMSPRAHDPQWNDVVLTNIHNAFETLDMLGCKNVSLESRPQLHVERAERKFGKVNGGYRYHVLVVRPAGARSGTPGIEIGTMPRHKCRGHFAEYGPEYGKGLLFGKLAGRFFVPPHVRGSVENGEVVKDYMLC